SRTVDLMIPPEKFPGGLVIENNDNKDIDKIIGDAIQDEVLIDELDAIYKTRTKHPKEKHKLVKDKKSDGELDSYKSKNRRALEHDAGLIRGCEYLKKTT
ncbi:unnamed protein product, partial [marine sediment metagenome]